MFPERKCMVSFGQPCDAQSSRTSCCGFLTGSVLSSTASMRLKIAVFAPMPRASESTATAVKPGFSASFQPVENVPKVVSGSPAEVVPGSLVNIHSVDAGEHLPATALVLSLIVRNPSLQHQGCVGAQVEQIVPRKGCGRADNITVEA